MGCDLVAVVQGLDSYLAKHGMSIIVLEGEASKRSGFAMVDGIDMSSVLTPLPSALGSMKLVKGVNDSGANTTRTLSILAQASQEFATL